MSRVQHWAERARQWKAELHALYFACRDPRTPRLARLLAIVVVAYGSSPIDLIPDFIPVLGYLDDLLLLPAGILLVRRMIPPNVLADCRERAHRASENALPSRTAALLIATAWLVVAWLVIASVVNRFR